MLVNADIISAFRAHDTDTQRRYAIYVNFRIFEAALHCYPKFTKYPANKISRCCRHDETFSFHYCDIIAVAALLAIGRRLLAHSNADFFHHA